MVPRPFNITRRRYKSRSVPFAKKFAVKLAKSLIRLLDNVEVRVVAYAIAITHTVLYALH